MTTVRTTDVESFLAGHRFAIVGASDDEKNFGRAILTEFRAHGYEVVPVNPSAQSVAGETAYASLAEVPGDLDGVVVMVNASKAADVVHDCVDRGVDKIWLFKGIGGPGAVAEDALAAAAVAGATVIPGACPLMFLEPVGWFHRVHRGVRHLNGSLDRSAA